MKYVLNIKTYWGYQELTLIDSVGLYSLIVNTTTHMSYDMSRKFYVMTETNIIDNDVDDVGVDTSITDDSIEDIDIDDIITQFRMEVKDYLYHRYCVILDDNNIDNLVNFIIHV